VNEKDKEIVTDIKVKKRVCETCYDSKYNIIADSLEVNFGDVHFDEIREENGKPRSVGIRYKGSFNFNWNGKPVKIPIKEGYSLDPINMLNYMTDNYQYDDVNEVLLKYISKQEDKLSELDKNGSYFLGSQLFNTFINNNLSAFLDTGNIEYMDNAKLGYIHLNNLESEFSNSDFTNDEDILCKRKEIVSEIIKKYKKNEFGEFIKHCC